MPRPKKTKATEQTTQEKYLKIAKDGISKAKTQFDALTDLQKFALLAGAGIVTGNVALGCAASELVLDACVVAGAKFGYDEYQKRSLAKASQQNPAAAASGQKPKSGAVTRSQSGKPPARKKK